jgi:hypothetical protein
MGVDLGKGKGATCAANGYLRIFRIFNEKFELCKIMLVSSIQIDTYQLSKANWRDNMSMKKTNKLFVDTSKRVVINGSIVRTG